MIDNLQTFYDWRNEPDQINDFELNIRVIIMRIVIFVLVILPKDFRAFSMTKTIVISSVRNSIWI